MSKFANLHPGGSGVLLDAEVAGQDATTVFYGLHRSEVLQKPQYQRLRIGQIEGEKPQIKQPLPGDISTVSDVQLPESTRAGGKQWGQS